MLRSHALLPTLAVCAAAIGGVTAVGAASVQPSWSRAVRIDASGLVGLQGVSCPSVRRCVAVDERGRELTFDPSSPGRLRATTIDPGNQLWGVVCPSVNQCTTIDDEREVTFDPGTGAVKTSAVIDSSPPGTFPPTTLVALACASARQCTAVDFDLRAVTFDPLRPGSPTPVPVEPTGGGTSAIACPSTSQCTVVDEATRVATFNPLAPVSPAPSPVSTEGYPAVAVACPSLSLCVAIDRQGGELSFNPNAPQGAERVTLSAPPYPNLTAIACPSAGQCTAIGDTGDQTKEITFNPNSPTTARGRAIAPSLGAAAVSCPARNQCTAVAGSEEITFNPQAPAKPSAATIGSGNALLAVACPSARRCVALDVASGTGAARELTFDPLALHLITPRTVDRSRYARYSLACPAVNECTVVDGAGGESTFDPASATQTASEQLTFPHQCSVPTCGGTLVGPTLHAVACASVRQCTAVGGAGVEATFDPRHPVGVTRATIDAKNELDAVACPSTSQCTATDGRNVVTFNPRSPRTGRTSTPEPGLVSLACPSVRQCTAISVSGQEITFNPHAPGAATHLPTDPANTLTSIACPSTRYCVAVDQHGNALVGDPHGSAWPVEHIRGAGALQAVACAPIEQCVAVDALGQAATSTGRTRSARVNHAG